MPEEVSSSPNEGAAGEAVDGGTPTVVVNGSAAATTTKDREKWFIEMRGWIMVLAVQVASFTYQAGLNPPDHFDEPKNKGGSDGTEDSTDSFRYKMFFYSNTTAFLTSLAIIILLMNRPFYRSFAKVTVLEIIMVLDMIGLMAAYWAGSASDNRTNMSALVLTALVLFIIYIVYMVQLVQKLYQYMKAQLVQKLYLYAVALVRNKLWGFFAAVRRPVPVVPECAATGDDGHDTLSPPNEQDIIDGATRAPPPLDVGPAKSELRRRESRLMARTPGKSTMLSP